MSVQERVFGSLVAAVRVLVLRVLPVLLMLEAGFQIEWWLRGGGPPAASGRGSRIVVLGDSVSGRYSQLLGPLLERRLPGEPVIVETMVIAAASAPQLVDHLEANLRHVRADVVIAMMGADVPDRARPEPAPETVSPRWRLLTWTVARDTVSSLQRSAELRSLRRLVSRSADAEAALSDLLGKGGTSARDLAAALASCPELEPCVAQARAATPPSVLAEVLVEAAARLQAQPSRLDELATAATQVLGDGASSMQLRLRALRIRGDADEFAGALSDILRTYSRRPQAVDVLPVIAAEAFADPSLAERTQRALRSRPASGEPIVSLLLLLRALQEGRLEPIVNAYRPQQDNRAMVVTWCWGLRGRDLAAAQQQLLAIAQRHPQEAGFLLHIAFRLRLTAQGDARGALAWLDATLASPQWQADPVRSTAGAAAAARSYAFVHHCDEAARILGRFRSSTDREFAAASTAVQDSCRADPQAPRAPAPQSEDGIRQAWRRLEELSARRGFAVIALQYPGLPLPALRAVLPEGHHMTVVDPTEVFRHAVAGEGHEAIYLDSVGGQHAAHLTASGARLLADLVMPAVVRALEDRRPHGSANARATPAAGG